MSVLSHKRRVLSRLRWDVLGFIFLLSFGIPIMWISFTESVGRRFVLICCRLGRRSGSWCGRNRIVRGRSVLIEPRGHWVERSLWRMRMRIRLRVRMMSSMRVWTKRARADDEVSSTSRRRWRMFLVVSSAWKLSEWRLSHNRRHFLKLWLLRNYINLLLDSSTTCFLAWIYNGILSTND